ncbi:MAG: nucleoside triphosphate pyrophosphohydrolase [Phenylobacterium sp.]|uniref:nucleoside triphosphate pyrophosphohydrolase n=1 Tax=Phenylobacterium sp. TaxID=1871053 RepID=UPI00391C984D
MRFVVEKLIRDKLPAIMRAQGLSVFERRLGEAEYLAALQAKLVEEAAEAQAAASPEELAGELADLSEVMLALMAAAGVTAEQVERLRLAKRAERGGFDGRVYNAAVEGPPDLPAIAYYLARPLQYPEVPLED